MMFPSSRVRGSGLDAARRLHEGPGSRCARVSSVRRRDPFAGTVFVFRSRRANRLRLSYRGGTGLVMACKRLKDAISAGRRTAALIEAGKPDAAGPGACPRAP